ncbi:hypothetical protein BCV70DRAFT_158084 [Testicularia cyperi]|uniref:Uncharacterized protein n=1 Tax=Testicularia cyperi TaxID=1882483 RepID=A0A317XSX4_9BASI|nr:hypothetical protein BCV70DRAFT_158084 [Testicularia cyperi]
MFCFVRGVQKRSGERSIPLPKGGATLSERIAALQRKTSNPTGGASRSTLSPNVTGNSAASGRLSPGDSPSRVGGGAAAVRDRIAKFQSSDEKPVLPRSSFGSPAPNPEISHARRQLPGVSAGKGTGAWGEGVLRPQMTGGVWLGGGAGGGWGDPSSASLRPQMTGSAFFGSGAPRTSSFGTTRLQRGVSDNIVHGGGRDAFADLDDDLVLTGRNRPETATPPASDRRAAASSETNSSPTGSQIRSTDLPNLPDTPSTEIDASKIEAWVELPQQPSGAPIPGFPEAPSATPTTPSKTLANGFDGSIMTPDTSIEIGIYAQSPSEVERIRRRAQDLQISDSEAASTDESWLVQLNDDLAGQIPKPVNASELAAVSQSEEAVSKDASTQQEPWMQGYETPAAPQAAAAVAATESNAKVPVARYDTPGTLPERAHVARTYSGRVDVSDPAAHKVQGPGLLVPRDEVAEARDLGADAVKAPLTRPDDDAARDGATAPTMDAGSGSEAPSVEKARQAVSIGRTKSQSQRLRRPPPGTVLSAADLDASDEEYEPGWASVTSVISSSRS